MIITSFLRKKKSKDKRSNIKTRCMRTKDLDFIDQERHLDLERKKKYKSRGR